MKKVILTIVACSFFTINAHAKPPKNQKSKFYDFGEQVIDGEIKKPTTLYVDTKKKVKFQRLLSLKKSFIPQIEESSKERTFK